MNIAELQQKTNFIEAKKSKEEKKKSIKERKRPKAASSFIGSSM
ncbi:MAG TPA: hypothetical protein VJ869_07095 [Sphaerochaeta sp.]|nr:hypothetical protein [Sphaerochaeta sp.]